MKKPFSEFLDSELHIRHHGTVYAHSKKNLSNTEEHKGKKELFLSLRS